MMADEMLLSYGSLAKAIYKNVIYESDKSL
jgi:hypothetical protein